MFKDKINQSVAEAAAKIMMGEKALHPNQQKLDVHEPEKDELTADDFKKLRAKKEVKQEEVERVDELSTNTMKSYVKGAKSDVSAHKDQKSSAIDQGDHKTASDSAAVIAKRQAGMATAKAKLNAEEVEGLLEYETNKDGKYVHNAKTGRYGGSEKPTDPFAGVRGPSTAALSAIEKEKQKKKKKFSEMVDVYNTTGIKGLFEELQIAKEEASQEEFNAELEKQKKKASGTAAEADKAKVAKPAVQAVQQEEIQVINADIANGVDTVNIAERELSGGEMKKKEEIVKSMKKGIEGFKSRYGKDAKSVMYATATKQAKGE
jgi:hypothetical protein